MLYIIKVKNIKYTLGFVSRRLTALLHEHTLLSLKMRDFKSILYIYTNSILACQHFYWLKQLKQIWNKINNHHFLVISEIKIRTLNYFDFRSEWIFIFYSILWQYYQKIFPYYLRISSFTFLNFEFRKSMHSEIRWVDNIPVPTNGRNRSQIWSCLY